VLLSKFAQVFIFSPGCSGTLQQVAQQRSEAYKRNTGTNINHSKGSALQKLISKNY